MRIPLTSKQKRNLQTLLDFFSGESDALAEFIAANSADWLEETSDAEMEFIHRYCEHADKNPQATFDALAHFHKQGWVLASTLDMARVALGKWRISNLRCGARHKIEKKILSILAENQFHDMDTARMLLQRPG